MAEYINRENANFHCSYHGDCMGSGSECDKCSDNVIDYQDFMKIPKADVVEREKIDVAIKEMERYSTSFEYANRHDLADAVDYCIGVIQRKIGE